MDLNDALAECRKGLRIRCDGQMSDGWKIYFDPSLAKENEKLPPRKQHPVYYYINPSTGPAYAVRFSDEMKASSQWRVVE